jgi:hypothetical protein
MIICSRALLLLLLRDPLVKDPSTKSSLPKNSIMCLSGSSSLSLATVAIVTIEESVSSCSPRNQEDVFCQKERIAML